MKIDIFPHILTKKYIELLTKRPKPGLDLDQRAQQLYTCTRTLGPRCQVVSAYGQAPGCPGNGDHEPASAGICIRA